MRRAVLAVASLAIVVAACGGSMTASGYVEELDAIVSRALSEFEHVVVAYNQIAEPTLADEVAFLEQQVALGRELFEGFVVLDPPELLTDVHGVIRDVMTRELAAAEGLARVAETVSSRDQLLRTPEFAEYRAANDAGAGVCIDVQARLDDLSAGRLILMSERGELIIAEASPQKYTELSRARVFEDGHSWSTPVLSAGRIYCRSSEGELVCRDHRGRAEPSSTPAS